MYRAVATTALDERDRAVGAILIGEALIASCDLARAVGVAGTAEGWRAIQDAHDAFPEIWRQFDRARKVLAQRGVAVTGYDELRPLAHTQLATGDDESAALDPLALDDVKRAAAELRLAVPGADWAEIEKRTRGLVSAPLLRKKRNRLIVGALVVPFTLAVFAWISALVPEKKPDRNLAMKHELADIAQQRRLKIVELQRSLGDVRCDPATARELAKQLVMDGRGWDAKDLGTRYSAKCGEDPVVMHWANAPHP